MDAKTPNMNTHGTQWKSARSLDEGFEAVRSLNIQSCSAKEKAKERRKESGRGGGATANEMYDRNMHGAVPVPRLTAGRGSTPRSPTTVSRSASFPAGDRQISDGGGGGGGGCSISIADGRSAAFDSASAGCGLVGRAEDYLGSSVDGNTSSTRGGGRVGSSDGGGPAEQWAVGVGANNHAELPVPTVRVGKGRGRGQYYR